MTPLVACRRAEIADLCRRYHVRRLQVFGSAGGDSGDFDPARSDVDFLVAFDEAAGRSSLKTFFRLKEDLEKLLQRPVDLVSAQALRNPYMPAQIERSKETVYAP
jgi:uncharacterized protein